MFLSRHNGANLLNSAQLVRPHFAATNCRILVACSMDRGEIGRSLVSGDDRVRKCSSVVGLILSALRGIVLLLKHLPNRLLEANMYSGTSLNTFTHGTGQKLR